MRLWTLHPRYLDPQGLVALWREALLASAVLRGETEGYRHHPQLARFRAHDRPLAAIDLYIAALFAEARARGYRFDRRKCRRPRAIAQLRVAAGQLTFEREWLRVKLRTRNPEWLSRLPRAPQTHPLFRVVPGPVESWERSA